jgi:rhodanese-related sulfurtransferase
MTPSEAHKLQQSGQAIVIDVREEYELVESGIAVGALWMPTSKIDPDNAEWTTFKAKLPKDKKIALYCKAGGRSGMVAEFLGMEGYDTVNVGGFKDWAAAQLPIKKFP